MQIRRQQGYTLLELVLTLTIASIIAVSITIMMRSALSAMSMSLEWSESYAGAQRAADQMFDEIMDIGTGDITAVTSTQLTFTDISSLSTNFRVVNPGSNGVLNRGTEILAENISALTFTYYDSTGATTLTAANVRAVKAEMTVRVGTRGDFKVRFIAYPRGLHYSSYN